MYVDLYYLVVTDLYQKYEPIAALIVNNVSLVGLMKQVHLLDGS